MTGPTHAAPVSVTPAPPVLVMRSTCACGKPMGPTGECAECRRTRSAAQPKLRVNQPGDRYEREADRVAAQVLHPSWSHATRPTINPVGSPGAIQRQANEEEEIDVTDADLLSMKEIPGHPHEMSATVAGRIHSMDGGGTRLAPPVRAFMEQRFGYDFSRVRVHTDARAADTARSLHARAYTVGRNIAFGSGEYQPNTTEGQHLLAHELAHVVQQGSMSQGNGGATIMRKCDCSKDGRGATTAEDTFLRSKFPRLVTDDYCIIGPESPTYNCIAWTVSDNSQWIWNQVDSVYGDKDGKVSIADFDAFYYAVQHLTPTTAPNSNSLVALFATASGPTHASIIGMGSPDCGTVPYTSKLGKAWVLSHDLYQLEGGSTYGDIVRYYEPA